MDQLTDIATLSTVAGATVGAGIITQMVKILGPSSWGGAVYRRVAALAGITLMVLAAILGGDWAIAELVLATLNGAIAGAAASAGYDTAVRAFTD
jgi:hypothetical protein